MIDYGIVKLTNIPAAIMFKNALLRVGLRHHGEFVVPILKKNGKFFVIFLFVLQLNICCLSNSTNCRMSEALG